MVEPTFYVVAGPNGSGKTTFAINDPALKAIPFINADIEAQRINPARPAEAALAAGRITLANIAREISMRAEFALETTLSGASTLAAMRRAQAAGYQIDLTYLCLSSPAVNIGRVSMRVAAGGHHIPEADIQRRYSRSLENLPVAVALSDRARVFDNTESAEPRLIFEIHDRRIVFMGSHLPSWFKAAFQVPDTPADSCRHIGQLLQSLSQADE